jgi:hypothetical protein
VSQDDSALLRPCKARKNRTAMDEYEGFGPDDWLADDDLPDEDEQTPGTGEPVHAVSNVYPFACIRIEYDREIPNNPYDLHLDEAIRLTLVPAGMYRDRKRYRVKEVLEIAATVQPALEAARWFLSHGEHPERQMVLTGPYIPPPPPDHPKFKSYNPKGHIQYCKLGDAAELWTVASRGKADDMTTEQRVGKLTRQVLRKAGIDPDVIQAAEAERDRLWHAWHWRPWCEKMTEKADKIESGKWKAVRHYKQYRLTKHLDPKTYARLKVEQYRRQIATRMEGRQPNLATELQIAVETEMRRLPKPLAKWAARTSADLPATCREWARRMAANKIRLEKRRHKAAMKRSIEIEMRTRAHDWWERCRGKLIPWRCKYIEFDGQIVYRDPYHGGHSHLHAPEWVNKDGIHPDFADLHAAAIQAQKAHPPIECEKLDRPRLANGRIVIKVIWEFNDSASREHQTYSASAIRKWLEMLPDEDQARLLDRDLEAEVEEESIGAEIEWKKKRSVEGEVHSRAWREVEAAIKAEFEATKTPEHPSGYVSTERRKAITDAIHAVHRERLLAEIEAGAAPPWEEDDWGTPQPPEGCEGMTPPWEE